MKIGNYIIALAVTLIVILSDITTSNKLDRIQNQIDNMNSRIDTLESKDAWYITKDALNTFQEVLDKLSAEVKAYQQDIEFWNEQVDNVFGTHNARYFKEGRGK